MVLLGDKAVGDIIKIKENNLAVNYIIVHKGLPSSMYDSSCDGVWLLREAAHSRQIWDSTGKYGESDYRRSDIETWLNYTFLSTIDSKICTAIKTVKIPYHNDVGTSGSVASGSNGLSCKVFLLSGYEVGFSQSNEEYFPIDGAKLSYFLNGTWQTAATSKRICKDSSGSAIDWWLRSPRTDYSYYVCGVDSDGSHEYCIANADSVAARPAFILPADLMVGEDGTIITNAAPTITSDTASGSNLSEVSEAFNFAYTVNDADGDTVTVTEYLDGVQTCTYTATLGAENTFEAVSNHEQFQKILNGQHIIKVVANDTKDDSEPYTVTFNKQVRTAVISLANPLPADDVIKAAVISVTGNIPKDATLEILVTNNALDENPVWEDMTQDYLKKINHVFANQAAVNGFAFNFRVTAARGASGEQGFISSIGGAFE